MTASSAALRPASDFARGNSRRRLFRPMGVDGVYGRTGAYEERGRGARRASSRRLAAGAAEVFRFPPVVSRALIEKSGYLKSFPHLLGCVCALGGDEARIERGGGSLRRPAEPGPTALEPSELVLAPAACYPVYPFAAARGPIAAGRARSSTSPAIVSAASPRAISIACNPSACANSSPSARPSRSIDVPRAAGSRARAGIADDARPLPPHRGGERSVLRPRRRDGREVPGRAGAEIRNARAGPIGRNRRPPA